MAVTSILIPLPWLQIIKYHKGVCDFHNQVMVMLVMVCSDDSCGDNGTWSGSEVAIDVQVVVVGGGGR